MYGCEKPSLLVQIVKSRDSWLLKQSKSLSLVFNSSNTLNKSIIVEQSMFMGGVMWMLDQVMHC